VRLHRARRALHSALLRFCTTCPTHGFLNCACEEGLESLTTKIGITEAVIGIMMRAETYLAEKDTVAAKAAAIPASEVVDTVAEEDSAAVMVAVVAAVMAASGRCREKAMLNK
jgi:hypothetical protein